MPKDVTSSQEDMPASALQVAEIERLTLYAAAQERKVSGLQATVAQLQHALDTRVVTERAIGILAERFALPIPDAVELLRSAARHSRRKTRSLAEEIIDSRGGTPEAVTAALGRRYR